MNGFRWSLALSIALCTAVAGSAQPVEPLDSSHMQLLLEKLNVVGSALYIAAHPDDENTAMLSWLANGKKVRAGYLSMTRGDGGQNLIGTEKGDRLGVLRTEELLAARRVDGAEQFFTRAIDFGYTKSPEETFSIWDHEKILADVVWVIRKFQPDVIITRFPADGSGGHGQHTASAILAAEAFEAAADRSRFPEQLRYVQPWQARRLFWNNWRPDSSKRASGVPPLISVDLGEYNPLLGQSYLELAAQSRSQHKSQGFGSAEQHGSSLNYLEIQKGPPASSDPFEGVDLSWERIPKGAAVGRLLERAAKSYLPTRPAAILPLLFEADAEMARLPGKGLIPFKREQLRRAISTAAGLWLGAVTATQAATPGSTVKLTITAVNRSGAPMRLLAVSTPWGGRVEIGETLNDNTPVTRELPVTIPEDAQYSQPYWLRTAEVTGGPDGMIPARYEVNDPALLGNAEDPPVLPVTFTIASGSRQVDFDVAASYRSTDKVRGEEYLPFEIIPAATVAPGSNVIIFPSATAKRVRVSVRGTDGLESGTLHLELPDGWKSEPRSTPISLRLGDEGTFDFVISPPSNSETATLTAVVTAGGKTFDQNLVSIEYTHIRPQIMLEPAKAKLVRLDLDRRGNRIGYVMGPGDDVPDALRQAGYEVTLLSDDAIAGGDLTRFDTIVAGVRAFNTRSALKEHSGRLMDYVRSGGTFVVQYNTADSTMADSFAPYPIKLSRDRVTMENAPITIIDPDQPLLSGPNRITAADFNGWIQERGLYFPSEWDSRYQTVIASHDPGEKDLAGGILIADYGKGKYIYTSYAWFRELPAGVPGAYRLFVNMVSAGH